MNPSPEQFLTYLRDQWNTLQREAALSRELASLEAQASYEVRRWSGGDLDDGPVPDNGRIRLIQEELYLIKDAADKAYSTICSRNENVWGTAPENPLIVDPFDGSRDSGRRTSSIVESPPGQVVVLDAYSWLFMSLVDIHDREVRHDAINWTLQLLRENADTIENPTGFLKTTARRAARAMTRKLKAEKLESLDKLEYGSQFDGTPPWGRPRLQTIDSARPFRISTHRVELRFGASQDSPKPPTKQDLRSLLHDGSPFLKYLILLALDRVAARTNKDGHVRRNGQNEMHSLVVYWSLFFGMGHDHILLKLRHTIDRQGTAHPTLGNIRAWHLRGLGALIDFLRKARQHLASTCIVCSMSGRPVPREASSVLRYQGVDYSFCSDKCREEFKKNPGKYCL